MAAQAGNEHARDLLVEAYLPLVYNIVGHALNGHADGDDVVQETMVAMVRGLPGLREPESFRSWLVTIALNEVRKARRHRAGTSVLPGTMDELAEVPGWPSSGCANGTCTGRFTGTHLVLIDTAGHRLTPDTVVPAHISGDITVLPGGDLAWAFVAATPNYRSPLAGSPTTTVLSLARLRLSGR